MSTTHELRWGALRVVSTELGRDRRTVEVAPRVELTAYTKTEQARLIPLTTEQLKKLIADAAAALVELDHVEQRRAARDERERRRQAGTDRHRA